LRYLESVRGLKGIHYLHPCHHLNPTPQLHAWEITLNPQSAKNDSDCKAFLFYDELGLGDGDSYGGLSGYFLLL
jgi:hypothetical protein